MKKLFIAAFAIIGVVGILYAQKSYFRITNEGRYIQYVTVRCQGSSVYECSPLASAIRPSQDFECFANRIELYADKGCKGSIKAVLSNTGYSDIIVRDNTMRKR